MKKQTVLYILLIFLIISNGFFLVHYLCKNFRKGHKPGYFIVKELNFDEKQMSDYDSVSDLHFDKMKSVSKEIMNLKGAMFSKISDDGVPQAYLDSITDLIAVKEKERDMEVFRHLQKVRGICNAEQKERFSKIVGDAMKRRGHKGKYRGRN
ncbi:hypothetical protein [Winogradskyella luteola]|uniref:Periplasmic heavy metal sensor n=1 Tax=Winogradskyella luteola TaxID=2828330 RepID=A0A9X1F7F9_9FLAO|nr:hypothetical protein [Winogradskyella luteola]MBV7268619.1 hypothetical protein [Winogradskyella luteola]